MLLNLYLENKESFRNPSFKKSTLWKVISGEMQNNGRGRLSWKYYDLMEAIFETDVCVNPLPCVASLPILSKNEQTRKIDNAATSADTAMENTPSAFDIVSDIYPHTNMVPAETPHNELLAINRKRRVNEDKNPHVKNVRQHES